MQAEVETNHTQLQQKDDQLQQKDDQLQQKNGQLQRQGTELQERATQINQQQRELQTLRVRNMNEIYSNTCNLLHSCSDCYSNKPKRRMLKSADSRESYKH